MPRQRQNSNDPATRGVAVTPSDSTELPEFDALWIGGAGNVSITHADGTTVVYAGAQAGGIIPVGGTKVNSTSTTATSIVALY